MPSAKSPRILFRRVRLAPLNSVRKNVAAGVNSPLVLVHNVHFEDHRAMSATTKHRAVTDKIPGLVRRELHFSFAALTHFDIHIQLANAYPVGNVCAFEHEHHWLSLLQSDLPGLKCKALCRHLNPLGGTFGLGHWRRKPRGHQGRGQQDQLHVLPLHRLSFEASYVAWVNLKRRGGWPNARVSNDFISHPDLTLAN